MNREERSVAVSESSTSAGGWGLRYPGLVMGKGGKNEVKEFTGMWGLKSGADLVAFTDTLSREVPVWGGPGKTFSEATTMLGLIRTARWFVARTQDFDGYTLFFISQFDGSLDKYFDDFVLNGKENLTKIWGQCVGCPSGPDATARDIVDYIARGQIKTLACYDVFPSLSLGQIYKAADWYEKTQKFQRAVAKGEGKLEEAVNAFFGELAESYKQVPSDAMIDTEVGRQWQYEDVAEHIGK
ncbi:hypothetical protein GFL38_13985 [Rhizobium leguminosarum bv. viciae]|uniref:hypothetical protein n=1 Tax=Rhizobium ruizarguesonis TaxID=2081791 RepID=UPI00143FB7A5|nr:hypothetical protein [Rhizobium ruizarguesonis]NKJ73364.1 hypothetical protein [Rhizobium leguminosarum bv. viciae]NKQ70953.1 hypothetical protein [Rhizobium ruizarguesonis]NKQ78680.1 hypothetical protein [Rhizobium ruizarguesonis]